jgi:chromosome segregation ATPase
MRDKDEYEIKKQYLKDELRDKEDVIEKIERELVHYLKNTEDMKTIKNNHEFELGEYEQEVAPIQDNFNRIETNVKQMNVEIMKEYNLKVEKTELINEQLQMVADMK